MNTNPAVTTPVIRAKHRRAAAAESDPGPQCFKIEQPRPPFRTFRDSRTGREVENYCVPASQLELYLWAHLMRRIAASKETPAQLRVLAREALQDVELVRTRPPVP